MLILIIVLILLFWRNQELPHLGSPNYGANVGRRNRTQHYSRYSA